MNGVLGCWLVRRDSWDRGGGGAALYLREGLDCAACVMVGVMVESLLVRIKGMNSNANVAEGVYYHFSRTVTQMSNKAE